MTRTTTESKSTSSAATQPKRPPTVAGTEPVAGDGEQLVEADLLVEDVSIDGMCGVY